MLKKGLVLTLKKHVGLQLGSNIYVQFEGFKSRNQIKVRVQAPEDVKIRRKDFRQLSDDGEFDGIHSS